MEYFWLFMGGILACCASFIAGVAVDAAINRFSTRIARETMIIMGETIKTQDETYKTQQRTYEMQRETIERLQNERSNRP